MSPQWAIAPSQSPFSKFGQVVTLPHPMEASESSSPPVPHALSLPPQSLLTDLVSLAAAFAIVRLH